RGGDVGETRWKLDVRLDLQARGKQAASGFPIERPTTLYEATPVAAWIEVPISSATRLKIGEQVVRWSRMDLLPASDVLARVDLSSASIVDPSLSQLPTPTARFDATLSDAFDATIAWSVVSLPHRVDLFGSSWALVGPGLLDIAGATRGTIDRLANSLDSATFLRVQQALLETDTTSPSFFSGNFGDVAARLRWRTGGVDVTLSYGNAASKLPQLDIDPALAAVATRGDLESALQLVSALDQGRRLIAARYPRFHQVALDFEGTAGPFTLSWELGASPSRPLWLLDDSAFPQQANRPVLQASGRAQWIHDEGLSLVAEIGAMEAISSSSDLDAERGHPLVVFGPSHALVVGMLSAHWAPSRSQAFDVGVVATSSGPSLAVTPRWEWTLDDHWSCGAFGGFFPDVRGAPSGPFDVRVADWLVGRDFVEAFVRVRR
ncbi:MAG: hypothetical protein ACHREM_20715, partial [Polyangiales bacterium]